MALKIFLSHSAIDEALASALVDCLLSSMILEDSELRCTSVPGHKLSVGTDFAAALLEDIGESSVVIGLITRNALSSSWVLFELGATWGSKKHMKPIVTGEVDLKALPGPVSGRHVARLSSRTDVARLLSEITKLQVRRLKFQPNTPVATRMFKSRSLTCSPVMLTHCPMASKAIGIEIRQRVFYIKSWDFGFYLTD